MYSNPPRKSRDIDLYRVINVDEEALYRADKDFFCPLTRDIIKSPVFCEGYSFEAEALSIWFKKYDYHPVTNVSLSSEKRGGIPDIKLEMKLEAYKRKINRMCTDYIEQFLGLNSKRNQALFLTKPSVKLMEDIVKKAIQVNPNDLILGKKAVEVFTKLGEMSYPSTEGEILAKREEYVVRYCRSLMSQKKGEFALRVVESEKNFEKSIGLIEVYLSIHENIEYGVDLSETDLFGIRMKLIRLLVDEEKFQDAVKWIVKIDDSKQTIESLELLQISCENMGFHFSPESHSLLCELYFEERKFQECFDLLLMIPGNQSQQQMIEKTREDIAAGRKSPSGGVLSPHQEPSVNRELELSMKFSDEKMIEILEKYVLKFRNIGRLLFAVLICEEMSKVYKKMKMPDLSVKILEVACHIVKSSPSNSEYSRSDFEDEYEDDDEDEGEEEEKEGEERKDENAKDDDDEEEEDDGIDLTCLLIPESEKIRIWKLYYESKNVHEASELKKSYEEKLRNGILIMQKLFETKYDSLQKQYDELQNNFKLLLTSKSGDLGGGGYGMARSNESSNNNARFPQLSRNTRLRSGRTGSGSGAGSPSSQRASPFSIPSLLNNSGNMSWMHQPLLEGTGRRKSSSSSTSPSLSASSPPSSPSQSETSISDFLEHGFQPPKEEVKKKSPVPTTSSSSSTPSRIISPSHTQRQQPQPPQQPPQQDQVPYRHHHVSPDYTNCYIRNLNKNIDTETLERIFSRFGPIESSTFFIHKETGEYHGVAFCNFEDHESAKRACIAMNNTKEYAQYGKVLIVCPASKKSEARARFRESGTNVYIKHLDENITESHLKALFSKFGKITSLLVMIDERTGMSRGFGFVNYDKPEEAAMAIHRMNGKMVGSRRIYVSWYQPKDHRFSPPPYHLSPRNNIPFPVPPQTHHHHRTPSPPPEVSSTGDGNTVDDGKKEVKSEETEGEGEEEKQQQQDSKNEEDKVKPRLQSSTTIRKTTTGQQLAPPPRIYSSPPGFPTRRRAVYGTGTTPTTGSPYPYHRGRYGSFSRPPPPPPPYSTTLTTTGTKPPPTRHHYGYWNSPPRYYGGLGGGGGGYYQQQPHHHHHHHQIPPPRSPYGSPFGGYPSHHHHPPPSSQHYPPQPQPTTTTTTRSFKPSPASKSYTTHNYRPPPQKMNVIVSPSPSTTQQQDDDEKNNNIIESLEKVSDEKKKIEEEVVDNNDRTTTTIIAKEEEKKEI